MGLLFTLILLSASAVINTVATEEEVRAYIGDTVALPCRVNVQQCGQLHSVKWYKDANRVYVLSHHGSGRAEGGATERMTVEYNNDTNGAVLKISPVEGEDEATYKCEITYIVVREHCDVIQILKLKTLKIPDNIKIHKRGDPAPLPNSTVIGPMEEGDELDLICEATGGKPTPMVRWFNGSTEISRAKYSVSKSKDDVETGMSTLKLTLRRGDLLARFECRVESDALKEPIISWVQIDVNVRPLGINLTGVENHVVQGTNVKLDCKVFNARPAATVRWANGSNSITIDNKTIMESPINTKYVEEKDGTFTTISSLSFKASHWENGRTIHCFAENAVMSKNAEPELRSNLILDVRYPPVITVSPKYAVVNESTEQNTTSAFLNCVYFSNPQKLTSVAWLKDGRPLVLNDTKKFIGGNIGNPPLYITNVTREDLGEYTCALGNEIGTETSEESLSLNVIYTPDVEVVMEPFAPVKAIDKRTVLIMCNVTSGNPSNLLKVRWFLEGELMKEFPECNYTNIDENGNAEGNGGPFCGLDPSILSLERVDESFSGNYTCQGMNKGGWGPVSEPQELVVYYPPGPARIRYAPSKVVKGGSVNLTCTVESSGRPDNVSYIWHRGSHVLTNVTQSVYTIPSARLETRNNFSCAAQNEGGKGAQASVFVNVYAAPAFTKKPKTYQGILYTSKHINLSCVVECYPECGIVWYKDGIKLDVKHNHLYTVETHFLPPNQQMNDFESINSTLIWNMTAWPGGMLNKTAPNTNYTCQATSNKIGVGITSTAEIAVDYPPEEVTTSDKTVNVKEGEAPATVKCYGKGRPALSFQWKRMDNAEVISTNDVLSLSKMSRSDKAAYMCEASNKHGLETAMVHFNVQYAPDCSITHADRDGTPSLVCTALANPPEMTFVWRVKEGNETFNETSNIIQDGAKSYLLLDSSVENPRTYYCIANNSIGFSNACHAEVAGSLSWWKDLNQDKWIIIIASIIAIVIFIIIICVIIIILCRRKRADTKSPNMSSTEDKPRLGGGLPLGGTADPLSDPDKGFYENLPFHGMQNPPTKPYRPDPCELEYADVDYKSYGPIDYKAASIYAALKKNKNNNNKLEPINKDDLL